MARRHRRARQQLQSASGGTPGAGGGEPRETFCSIRALSWATGGFVGVVLVLMATAAYTGSKSRSELLIGEIFDAPDAIPASVLVRLDAIVVLGGGKPLSVEEPPVYAQRRCDDAVAVVEKRKKMQHLSNRRGIPILCLSAGTAHVPQYMSEDGLPVWEATASAAYLLSKHSSAVSPDDVYVETTSYDTIGNAYFARTSHTDVAGWRRLLVITNEFHMVRSKAIFDWVFELPRTGTKGTSGYELHYLSSPNVGLSDEALKARKEREMSSLTSVRKMAKTMRSLPDVWKFLTSKHDLYTAPALVKRAKAKTSNASDLVKKSYGGS